MTISKLLPVLFLSILFLTACDDEEALVADIDEIVLEAYLFGGQAVDSIKISRVIPFNAEEELPGISTFEPVITDGDGNAFPLSFQGDEFYYHAPELIVEEGQAYTFSLAYNGKEVSAQTFVPAPPTELSLSATSIGMTLIEDFTDLQNQTMPDPFEMSWAGESGAYYFVEVTNIEADPDPINALFAASERPPLPQLQTAPSTDQTYRLDLRREINYFGRHQVVVYRVNPEYVLLYQDPGDGLGGLTENRTNIANGFGVFTGLTSVRDTFNVYPE
jgi:hypothetical protein